MEEVGLWSHLVHNQLLKYCLRHFKEFLNVMYYKSIAFRSKNWMKGHWNLEATIKSNPQGMNETK